MPNPSDLAVSNLARDSQRRPAPPNFAPGSSYRSGALTEKDLETAAFNVFLYGRMIEAAAEIDDHLNRGRNMDTRTLLEQCAFVV
jgi:hypothetical protein